MKYTFSGFLYKGIHGDTLNTKRNTPTWFALQKETSEKYGKNILRE